MVLHYSMVLMLSNARCERSQGGVKPHANKSEQGEGYGRKIGILWILFMNDP